MAFVVAVLALVFVAPVTGFASAGRPADCAAADTGVQVRLVIDFGILAGEQGAPAAVSSQCRAVAAGANGFKVIEAGGHTYRVNNADLLCAIDGYPQGNECGDRTAAGYRYWAYFSGGAKWTYSGVGPGYHSVNEGSVEGWHFVSGKGNPTDPPPNASPQSCAPTPTTAPPTAAPTTARPGTPPASNPSTPNVPGGTPGGGAGTGSGGSTGGGAAKSPSTTVAGAGPTSPASGGAGGPAVDPGAVPTTAIGGTEEPAAAPPSDGQAGSPDGTAFTGADPSETSGTGTVLTAGASDVEVAASPTAARSSSAGLPIGAIVGGLAVVALGGFAVLRMRVRPEDT